MGRMTLHQGPDVAHSVVVGHATNEGRHGVNTRRRALIRIAVVLGAVGLILGLGSTADARIKPRVTVVGDSITAMSAPEIAAALAPDYRPTVDGVGGTSIAAQLPTIASDKRPFHDWVIELGTNDARFGDYGWRRYFVQEVGDLVNQRCVIFVTVNPRIGPLAVALDGAIAVAVGRNHPHRFHSLDWGNIEWQNPAWLMPDGIHPTPAGAIELASLEAQALNTDCR